MHVSGSQRITSTVARRAFVFGRAWAARDIAIRLRGQNLTWRVLVDGAAGVEEVASGVLPSGTPTTVRVQGIPPVIAGNQIVVEFALTTGSTPTLAILELGYQPTEPGQRIDQPGSGL